MNQPRTRQIIFALVGITLVVSISASYFAIALLFFLWMNRIFHKPKGERWTPSPLNLPILFYILWGIVACASNGFSNPREIYSGHDAFLLFFLFSQGIEADELTSITRWFIFASVFVGFIGILQFFSQANFQPTPRTFDIPAYMQAWPLRLVHFFSLRNGRAVGSRSHPLTYAECFIPALFILLTWLLFMHLQRNKSSWKIVVAGGGGLATLLLGILFSQSRGVWLGVGLGLVINSLLLPKKLKYVGLVGLILFGSLLWFASPQIRTRAQSIFSMTSGSAADQQSSATRFSLWKAALQEIKQKPLFGNGLKEVELRVSTPPEAVGKTWSETHNSFLQVALDRGLVGLGLFLWILIVALGTILRTPKPWRTALLASFAAFMVAGLTESWIGDKEVAMIFWALLGAAEHLRRQGNRDEKIKN